MLSLFRRNSARRQSQSFSLAATVPALESRELLSATSLAHSAKPAAKAAQFGGGYWSGFAQYELMEIQQKGKKVQVSFSTQASDWSIGGNSNVTLNETATGKGKVKKDTIHFVLTASAFDGNTGKSGQATLTFDEKLTSSNKMSGIVKIEINGNTYATNEFGVHYGV